jgi:hypothetical protein
MSQNNGAPGHGTDKNQSDPSAGCGEPAREFSPSDVPDDTGADQRPEHPVPAPAPGVPVSEKEYQRLKDTARRPVHRKDVPAQEDRPRKER